VLSPRERAHFHETGHILITGSEGGRYEIRRGSYIGNVVTQQDVVVGARFGMFVRAGMGLCAHPTMCVMNSNNVVEELPQTDAYIAQILAIKANEKGFLRTANIYGWFGL
jgi:hypothetical protein